METTFGLPRYRFPPTQQVINEIVAFCRETIESAQVPVLLGYSLGKAQEILCSLDGAGLTPMLHGSVYQMTRIYEQFGQSFCKYVRYHKNEVAGKVLICPPSASHSPMIEKIPRGTRALSNPNFWTSRMSANQLQLHRRSSRRCDCSQSICAR